MGVGQNMMWGPGKPGNPSGPGLGAIWDDDFYPGDGFLDPDEFYDYTYGLCPDPLGAMLSLLYTPSGTTERMLPFMPALDRSRTPPPPVPLTYIVAPLAVPPPDVEPPEVLPPEVDPPLVLPVVRYWVATNPLLPPHTTGCQPLAALPRRLTVDPWDRTVMIEPLMLAVLRQFRPPGALLTVAEPVTALEPTVPEPLVEAPEVDPPLVLPELLRYVV